METTDIKNAGLKVTLPRMKILELLENSADRHLKAEDIYKMLLDSGEEIALATVYRVLTQFESAGLVTRHHFDGGHGAQRPSVHPRLHHPNPAQRPGRCLHPNRWRVSR